jgi:hypothetical protein
LTLENPARHRNPQCRITQMPEFHTIAPHAGPLPGKVPWSIKPNSALSAGLAHEGAIDLYKGNRG